MYSLANVKNALQTCGAFFVAGNEENLFRHPLHGSSQQPYELQTSIPIFQRRKLWLQNCAKSHILWKVQLWFKSRFCLALVSLHDSFPSCLESQGLGIWGLSWYLSCTSPPWDASGCNLIQRQKGMVVGVWSHTGKSWILTLLFPFYLTLVIPSQWMLFLICKMGIKYHCTISLLGGLNEHVWKSLVSWLVQTTAPTVYSSWNTLPQIPRISLLQVLYQKSTSQHDLSVPLY